MIGQGPSFIPKNFFGYQSFFLIFSNNDPNEMERNAGPRTSICSVIFQLIFQDSNEAQIERKTGILKFTQQGS
jgi:hypothetical protein